jgi:hypothetical protein
MLPHSFAKHGGVGVERNAISKGLLEVGGQVAESKGFARNLAQF